MKFIVLTSNRTGEKIYINLDKIVAVYKHAVDKYTVVQMVGDYNCGFAVKESVEKVTDILAKEEI